MSYVGPSPINPQDKPFQLCTWPGCGKNVKDLASHLLTHQCRRPFRCPVRWCQYATKGFARKYDKTRHALTHWKAVTRCKFCPESSLGLDVNFFGLNELKSHLKDVHAAEATGICSFRAPGSLDHGGPITCSACQQAFVYVQPFYSHLDDCVLEALQRTDPIDDINTQNLALVGNDENVLHTLAQHGLTCLQGPDPLNNATCGTSLCPGHLSQVDNDVGAASAPDRSPREPGEEGGMASKGNRAKRDKTKRRNRSVYPPSWGFNMNDMTLRRRRLVIFDGTERLHTEHMVLSRENEVHVELAEGNSYVTDLDLQTLSRVAEIEVMREVRPTDTVRDNARVLRQPEPGEPARFNVDGYDWSATQAVPFT